MSELEIFQFSNTVLEPILEVSLLAHNSLLLIALRIAQH